MGHKRHHPCFYVFLMKAVVMTFVAHCTVPEIVPEQHRGAAILD